MKYQTKKSKNAGEQKLDPNAFEKELLSWEAPEYQHHEKSLRWYLIASAVMLLLVWYGLATDGWTFSVAVIVFAGTYYLINREHPKVVKIKISKVGLKIGRHPFAFHDLKGFWINYDPPFIKKLYLRMASRVKPDVFVSLQDVDPSEVRKILRSHITEFAGQSEPFSDSLVRLFRL